MPGSHHHRAQRLRAGSSAIQAPELQSTAHHAAACWVLAMYRFAPIADPSAFAAALRARCAAGGVLGTFIVAREGLNGTVAGQPDALVDVLAWVRAQPGFAALRHHTSPAVEPPFHRLKVRVKAEIVTLGPVTESMTGHSAGPFTLPPAPRASAACAASDSDPRVPPAGSGGLVGATAPTPLDVRWETGWHVSAERWNTLLHCPNTLVVDVRNHYESALGTFPGALLPNTRSFREFPDFVQRTLWPAARQAGNADRQPDARAPIGRPGSPPQIAMFCTGGIRCEKASAYLRRVGFPVVYQLRGGVLGYLAEVPAANNAWRGECFVFDARVGHGTGRDGQHDRALL